MGEYGYKETRVVSHSFYVQLLPINLISLLKWKVWLSSLINLYWAI